MDVKMINVGYGNLVAVNRIVAIVAPESAPIKRLVQDAKENYKLIDATYGRKKRAVIVTDSGYVLLTSVQPETIYRRLNGSKLEDDLYDDLEE
ncbi:MAG: DUF370 domain-containing protein [Selenomonadales bacterium]|nr:DUF370 domain-containing protein [Selenomonadales bacterium]MDY3740659.1 DUF370 domain-containing protein [Selenomonadaceae bacterium]MEE1363046.1 DUF370 domain-containing protein [Selenomonadaceae bacterium]